MSEASASRLAEACRSLIVKPNMEKACQRCLRDRLFDLLGTFRLPGSAMTSAIGYPLRVGGIIRRFPSLAYASTILNEKSTAQLASASTLMLLSK